MAAQCAPLMSLTMEKIFNQKNFENFVSTPLGSRVNIWILFPPSLL
jgi:hypothetical protein